DTPPTLTLNLTGTTTLRVMAHKIGWEPTNIDTHTYIFMADVLSQPASPPGWPSTWDSGRAAHYPMESALVAAYGADLVQGMQDIPTLSLVTDQKYLFHPSTGIYLNPYDKGAAWERPVSVELINPDGSEGIQVDAGIRMQGMSGRSNIKKSFRLIFREQLAAYPEGYGSPKLNYALFPDSPVDSFDHLVLRAGYNDSIFGGGNAQYTRDLWAHRTYGDMGQATLYGNYVHLYINGLYWGLYNPIDRLKAAWASDHMGGEKDSDWDVWKANSVADGGSAALSTLMNISNGGGAYGAITNWQAYEDFKQWGDVDAIADYAILNYFAGTGDWRDGVNYGAARKREDGAGYKPVLWDAENVLENINTNNTGSSAAPVALHRRLLANPDYRLLVADRIHKHMFNGGAMTVAANQARYAALTDELELAIMGELVRWQDVTAYGFTTTQWQNERNRIINTHFAARHDIALNQFRTSSAFGSNPMYPAVDAPELNQHGGQVASGFALTVSSAEGTIYYTLDGTDPRLTGADSGSISPAALTYSGPVSLTDTTHVMARVLTTGGEWSALTETHFAIQNSPVRVTEIMYNPPEAPGAVTVADEDFGDGLADGFVVKDGTWDVTAGRYVVTTPGTSPYRAVAVKGFQSYLPTNFRISATVNRSSATGQALIIFDYHSMSNFKYAGMYSGSSWVVGSTRTGSRLAAGTIASGTDYDLEVSIIEGAAALRVNGVVKIAWDFDEALAEGQVGLGAVSDGAQFDDFTVSVDFDADAYEFVELLNT
ncbi:hypothetical protein LCGC14_1960270, partial [marine sediment metagenome]